MKPPKIRRVQFAFDERSLESVEKLQQQGRYHFLRIPTADEAIAIGRKMRLPWHYKEPWNLTAVCETDLREGTTVVTSSQAHVTCPACLHRLDPVVQTIKHQQAMAAIEEFWERRTALRAEDAARMAQENALSRGYGFQELRQLAWESHTIFQKTVPLLPKPYAIEYYALAEAMGTLYEHLRTIAPWEEPPHA